METAKLVLEYVRVVLSLPVVVGAIAVVVLVIYKTALRELLARIATVRFPGGEVVLSQAEKNRLEPPSEPPTPAPDAPQALTANQVHNTIAALQAAALLWEFRYLNYFLARDTQSLLDLLVGTVPGTTAVTAQIIELLYGAAERDAMLDALRRHRLVEQRGHYVEITDKGRAYLEHRGPLTPLPGARLAMARAEALRRWGEKHGKAAPKK